MNMSLDKNNWSLAYASMHKVNLHGHTNLSSSILIANLQSKLIKMFCKKPLMIKNTPKKSDKPKKFERCVIPMTEHRHFYFWILMF